MFLWHGDETKMSDEHFDAVIVGSGFGGSVMAYRLANAGLRVCLLERGKAFYQVVREARRKGQRDQDR